MDNEKVAEDWENHAKEETSEKRNESDGTKIMNGVHQSRDEKMWEDTIESPVL